MASSNLQHSKEEMESLMCSLCLDVFEEATLLRCGHTFCRRCLERHAQCHPPKHREVEGLSMLCPLCRQETALGPEGVASLPSNVSLNHLVEEFNDCSNPLRKLYDNHPRCSQCEVKSEEGEIDNTDSYAVVFCCDCDMYLCEGCLTAHKKFEQTMFKGHRVIPVKELKGDKQKGIINQMCSEHTTEAREFYCEDCRAVICHKCIIAKHNLRDHKIRERVEVESEFREKIAGLVTRCENEKDSLEAFIRETELGRRNVEASLEEVNKKIDQTFVEFQRQLEEWKKTLKAEVKAIDASCGKKLDSIKIAAQKMSSQLSTAQNILDCREGHSCLEGDALVSHEHLMKELEGMLESSQSWIKESQGIPGNVKNTAARVKFHDEPMDIARMDRVAVDKKWNLINEVKLPSGEFMSGLTVLSPERVLIGYGSKRPTDELSLDGLIIPGKLAQGVRDVTVLSNGRFAAVPKIGSVKMFDADGKSTSTNFKIPNTKSDMSIDSDRKDQIYVTYWDENLVQVFSPNGGYPVREIKVSSSPQQVHPTNCGHVVITSDTSVRVLNQNSKEVTCISSINELYPAVDNDDNLYIAEIQKSMSRVTIKRYTLDGVLVKTIIAGVKIKLSGNGIDDDNWYYMKCLSPDDIVLCTKKIMYVFKNTIDFGL